MASITIRNLDDALKSRLRIRAAQHGRSMEEEARLLIRDALKGAQESAQPHLPQLALSLFGATHGVELGLPKRGTARPVPAFVE